MSAFGIEIELNQACVLPEGLNKHDALDRLIDAVGQKPAVTDKEVFRRAVHDREGVMSTGIGGGIAIPHVRIKEVTSPTLGVGISVDGIDFGTLDNKPVHILVLFATPEGAEKDYLSQLAQVMLALRDPELFERLLACTTNEELAAVLNE